MYYVYHLIDLTTQKTFYIGKGCGNRMYNHEKEVKGGIIPNKNKYLFYKIKKILTGGGNIGYKKVIENVDENTALLEEIKEIKRIGKSNLCNLTVGGEGVSGYKFSVEQKRKNRERVLNFWKDPKWIEKYKQGMNKVNWDVVHKKQSKTLKNKFLTDPKFLKEHRKRMKKIHSTKEAKKRNSKSIKQFYITHPNQRKILSDIQKRLWTSGAYDNSKEWEFLSPKGKHIKFKNLQKFCRENGLSQSNMANVFRGRRNSHKGWKKYS